MVSKVFPFESFMANKVPLNVASPCVDVPVSTSCFSTSISAYSNSKFNLKLGEGSLLLAR